MKINNLGFDYSNLSTCTIKRKNGLISMIMFILGGSFLPMPIIFIIMFLTKSSIEINGVLVPYGDPAYNSFFYPFVGSFLFIPLLFIAIGIWSSRRKPKDYIIISLDPNTYEKIYYIYNRSKKEEIYLTEKFAIIYNSRYNSTYHEVDPNRIKEYFKKYIFWNDFDSVEDAQVKQTKNNTILKIRNSTNTRFGGSILRRYVFSNEINVVPETVTELIGYARTGRSNYQSRNKYFFENVNRAQHLEIHPEIKKVLHGLV